MTARLRVHVRLHSKRSAVHIGRVSAILPVTSCNRGETITQSAMTLPRFNLETPHTKIAFQQTTSPLLPSDRSGMCRRCTRLVRGPQRAAHTAHKKEVDAHRWCSISSTCKSRPPRRHDCSSGRTSSRESTVLRVTLQRLVAARCRMNEIWPGKLFFHAALRIHIAQALRKNHLLTPNVTPADRVDRSCCPAPRPCRSSRRRRRIRVSRR